MKILVTLLVIMFVSGTCFGTTFIPVPLEDQLSESSGVLIGKFLGKSYGRLKTGEVVTTASFKVSKSAGLSTGHLLNFNDVKVYYPGGVWQGIVYQIEGAPKFIEGEEYLLMVSKQDYGLSLNNLSLGKYNIKKIKGEKYFSSSVFPTHPYLGKISYEKMSDLSESIIGEPLNRVILDKFVFIGEQTESEIEEEFFMEEEEEGRSPASTVESTEKEETHLSMFWLALVFCLLGTYTMVAKRGEVLEEEN